MTHVLVTGANGQLGSTLLRISGAYPGVSVTGCGRAALDLREPDRIEERLADAAFDVLVNCAAFNRTVEAERDAREAFLVNARAVGALAASCRRRGARFVHVSTDYVFDGWKGAPYTETDARNPVNVYGASKALGEALALHFDPDATIVRTASLFGQGNAAGSGNFVDAMIRRASDGQPFEVVDDLWMSPTWADDLARMLLTLIEQNGAPGIYHGVNGGEATWFALARLAIDAAGGDPDLVRPGSAARDTSIVRPRYSVLSNVRIRALVGEVRLWQDAVRAYVASRSAEVVS